MGTGQETPSSSSSECQLGDRAISHREYANTEVAINYDEISINRIQVKSVTDQIGDRTVTYQIGDKSFR